MGGSALMGGSPGAMGLIAEATARSDAALVFSALDSIILKARSKRDSISEEYGVSRSDSDNDRCMPLENRVGAPLFPDPWMLGLKFTTTVGVCGCVAGAAGWTGAAGAAGWTGAAGRAGCVRTGSMRGDGTGTGVVKVGEGIT